MIATQHVHSHHDNQPLQQFYDICGAVTLKRRKLGLLAGMICSHWQSSHGSLGEIGNWSKRIADPLKSSHNGFPVNGQGRRWKGPSQPACGDCFSLCCVLSSDRLGSEDGGTQQGKPQLKFPGAWRSLLKGSCWKMFIFRSLLLSY